MIGIALVSALRCAASDPGDSPDVLALLLATADDANADARGGSPDNGAPLLTGYQVTAQNSATPGRGTLRIDHLAFESPDSPDLKITAYIGGHALEQLPDGTVINALSSQTAQGAAASFEFTVTSDWKYQILVAAENANGVSSRRDVGGHAQVCAAALPLPYEAGDCNAHCIRARRTDQGTKFEAELNALADPEEVYVDIYVYDAPVGFQTLGTDTTIVGGDEATPGLYLAQTTVDLSKNPYLCVRYDSLADLQVNLVTTHEGFILTE